MRRTKVYCPLVQSAELSKRSFGHAAVNHELMRQEMLKVIAP
jgi:hypothetical protein